MTAVEWLIQQIDNEDMGEIPMWVYDFCYNALEIEKQQIIDAATWGALQETGEKYYFENFKKDNQ